MKNVVGFLFLFLIPFLAVFSQTTPTVPSGPLPTSCTSQKIPDGYEDQIWTDKNRLVCTGSYIQVPFSMAIARDSIVAVDAKIEILDNTESQFIYASSYGWNFCPYVTTTGSIRSNYCRLLMVGYPNIKGYGGEILNAGIYVGKIDSGESIRIRETLTLNNILVQDTVIEFQVVPKVFYGDVNKDLSVNIMDGAKIFEWLVVPPKIWPDNHIPFEADLDGNYRLNYYDLYLHLSYDIGDRTSFPVENYYFYEGKGVIKQKELEAMNNVNIAKVDIILNGSELEVSFGEMLVTNAELEFTLPKGALIEPTEILAGAMCNVTYKDGKVCVGFANARPISGTLLKIINMPGGQAVVNGRINNGIPVNGASTIGGTTEVKEQNVPEKFSLLQNYPNPFNPSTKISFVIPQQTKVTLKVYDILGKEIATLVDGELTAGNHEAIFNASDVSSGIYIYRLSAEGFIETKKMILLK